MFVARSAARVRLARLAFLVLGLAPAAGLVAWAVHRRSDAHRAAVERRWQEAIGLPLVVGAVEHPRPGVLRGRECRLPAADGGPPIQLPLVEVESSADEDRIRVPTFTCDAAAATVIAKHLRKVISIVREGIDATSELDPVSQDLLIETASGLEKQLWMLEVLKR